MEIVICSAVKATDGTIVRGHRHSDAIRTLAGIPGKVFDQHQQAQGFITSLNRYVTRREGCEIQKAAGIESFYVTGRGEPEGAYLHGELYSEDLY